MPAKTVIVGQIVDINNSLKEISKELISRSQEPFYSSIQFWAIVISSLVSVGIVFLVNYFNNRPKHSNLVVNSARITKQQNEIGIPDVQEILLQVGRIVINNKGRFKASNVEAYIEKVIDDNEVREDFIPMPLVWTHGHLNKNGQTIRDIYSNQTVSLDIFNYRYNDEYTTNCSVDFAVATGNEIDVLSKVSIGVSEILVKIYQESGQVDESKLKISWDGKTVPSMEIIY